MGNAFTWILVSFPLYLLYSGKLTTFLKLAGTSAATTQSMGAPVTTGQVPVPAPTTATPQLGAATGIDSGDFLYNLSQTLSQNAPGSSSEPIN